MAYLKCAMQCFLSTNKAMKNKYTILLLVMLLGTAGAGRAQTAWRPFRPGLIYSFGTAGSPVTYLLRLDSAYTTAAGDSAWAFNRLLRPTDGRAMGGQFFFGGARKSRNNLFGARLLWQPGTAEFMLENVAEGSYQPALALRLLPRAAVGSTWAASTAPALSATLSSRTWQPVSAAAGSPFDSVATITLSSGAVLRLSRQYGLLAGPRWLATSGAAPQWAVAQLPVTFANSPLYPATLFDFQPGDRLGYAETPQSVGSPPCATTYTLRVIQTRQVVGDSLLYTYRQQQRIATSTTFGCGAPGTVLTLPHTGRLAFSLRTGRSPQFEALPLLSGEYRASDRPFATTSVVVGLGVATPTFSTCQTGSAGLYYLQMHAFGTLYSTLSDGNWFQAFAPQTGAGDAQTHDNYLQYFVKTAVSGTTVTCGSATNFIGLLPVRAALAAASASLSPNPAAEAATLTLAAPARSGAALRLTDALGRHVWSGPVPAGQLAAAVPLAGRPAGVYLLQVQRPEAASVTLRLVKE